MEALEFIDQLKKQNPNLVLDLLRENQEFINETSEDGISVLEYLLKEGMTKLAINAINLDTFDLHLSEHNYLQGALAQGFSDVALHLLKRGANPNYRLEGGSSALLTCLENENFSVAEVLVNHGAEVDIRDDKGWTPLIWASIKGRTKSVQFLLDHGANVNICNNDGWNALTGAFFKRRTEIVSLLQESGAVFGDKYAEAALLSAYDNGYQDVAKSLIEVHGTSVNIADEKDVSLLSRAVMKGDWPFVTYLLERGADANVFDSNGSPLIAALAVNGKINMIKTLLDHGADIHLKNKADGGTAIHAASDHNQIAIVEMLIEHGADVNVQNLDGATPLIRAAINGYTELVEKLVSLGANAELVAKNGKEWLTAKVFAYRHGRKDRYNNLLECAHQVIVDRLTLPGHWPDV